MRYAIIGAGLAGLVSAVEIHRADPSATVDVYEATDRIGGKLHTVAFECGPTDMGAEAFLARRDDAVEYFAELGLSDHVVSPSGLHSLIYSQGTAHAIPRGGVMGIPSSSQLLGDLVSLETAARIDAEKDADPLEWTVGGDRSVGEVVAERYGAEVADRVVSALLGGVYSCSAYDLGIRATVPQLAEALDTLADSGEKVTLSAAVAIVEASTRKAAGDRPVFGAFRGGYAELYEELAEVSGADIYLDTFISSIARDDDGFHLKGGEDVTYDKLVLATPAPTTALLLSKIAPEASRELKKIQLASSVVVGMKFDSDEGLPQNSGVLIASDEPGLHAKAFTLSSRKWPHLAERGGAIVRASFGRFGDDAIMRAEEDELVDWALDDLQTVTGFDGRAAGLSEIYTQRWFGGIPRYDDTHLDTVATIRSALEDVADIEVTGAWAGGVGVPAVLADARGAAARIAG